VPTLCRATAHPEMGAMRTITVLAMSGSLRAASLNKGMLAMAQPTAPRPACA